MLGKGVENSLLDLLVFLLQTPDFSTVFPFLLCLESQVVSLGSPACRAAWGCFLPFVLSSGFAVVSVSPEALHGVNPNSQALICVACGLAKGTRAVA